MKITLRDGNVDLDAAYSAMRFATVHSASPLGQEYEVFLALSSTVVNGCHLLNGIVEDGSDPKQIVEMLWDNPEFTVVYDENGIHIKGPYRLNLGLKKAIKGL